MRSSRGVHSFSVFLAAFLFAMLLTASLCLAGVRWTADGVAVCTATNFQVSPQVIPDGSGGAIICWLDYRSGNSDIYVQRVDSSGASLWTAGGVAVCTAANSQTAPQLITDGSGGVIITWQDQRLGVNDIYARKVNSSGTPQWTADGVAVCSATNAQISPQITEDGSGGAIIAWQDERAGNYDIYARRINSSGTPQWTADGVAVCTASNSQNYPQLIPDGTGGAIVTWADQRAGNVDIYARRINSSGTPQWTADGVAVCTAADFQQSPQITTDGSDGAIIAWGDRRSGSNDDVYAQRVNGSGTPLWTGDGVAVCTAANDQYDPQITVDGSGGAVIVWEDARPATSTDIYAQRVNSAGVPQWTVNGEGVSTAANNQENPQMTADGSGGAIFTWDDMRSASFFDVYTQRIDSSGTPRWTVGGMPVSTAANDQVDPQIAGDGTGGAIIAWEDARSGTDFDIYTQRVSNPAPVVGGITPASGTGDTTVHVSDLAGAWFSDVGGAPEVRLERSGQPDITATGVSVVSDSRITCDLDLAGAVPGAWDVVVENADGQEGRLASGFTVEEHAFFFAEGYTGTNFIEYLCLGNPGGEFMDVDVTYMFKDGTTQDENYGVPARSRVTISVNGAVGQGREVSIKCTSGSPFVAERPMYFDYTGAGEHWTGGHDVVGATAPSDTWFFAEGYTGAGFDEYVCVLNPGGADADLTFRFQTQAGEIVRDGLSVPAHSRETFLVDQLLGEGYETSLKLKSTVPVVAERPMYFDYTGYGAPGWNGGHCVMGASELAKEYFFAEGYTGAGFDEYLTIQNPHGEEITVDATYQLGPGQGGPLAASYTVPARGRATVYVNSPAPAGVGPGVDVSVRLTCSETFLAERPMYFDYTGMGYHAWTGGHCVIGATAGADTWFFAEGYTGDGFEEWLCIQNPGTKAADVTITYYTGGADPIVRGPFGVAASTRASVYVNGLENYGAGSGLSLSAKVTSTRPVVCERPMYFDSYGWTGGHDVVGYAP